MGLLARSWLCLALVSLALPPSPAVAQKKYGPGVSDREIKIGNLGPYSGPYAAYSAINKAEAAYFAMINEKGGVNGRKIAFLSEDDGYSPPRTEELTRKLVEQDGVLLIFGSIGTPTNAATQKYLNDMKVPQLFVSSGAGRFADSAKFPWSMGWSPTYQIEAWIDAKYILGNYRAPRIGSLYEADDMGDQYMQGLRNGLGEQSTKVLVGTQSLGATNATVDTQIAGLRASGANILFVAATPQVAAEAIHKTYDIGWKPQIFLAAVARPALGALPPAEIEKSVGTLSAAYLKDPADPLWDKESEIKAYAAWAAKYYPGGTGNVLGYSLAQTLIRVLTQCGDDLTRGNVMKQAASLKKVSLPMLLPSVALSTSPTDYHPVKSMQLMKFNGSAWQLFGGVISAKP